MEPEELNTIPDEVLMVSCTYNWEVLVLYFYFHKRFSKVNETIIVRNVLDKRSEGAR